MEKPLKRILIVIGIFFLSLIPFAFLVEPSGPPATWVLLVSLCIGILMFVLVVSFFKSNIRKIAFGFILSFLILIGLNILIIILMSIFLIVVTLGMALLMGLSGLAGEIFYLVFYLLLLVSFVLVNRLMIERTKDPFRKKGFIGGYVFVLFLFYRIVETIISIF